MPTLRSTNVEAPLPDWVQEIRPHQLDAVKEAVEYFKAGVQCVFLDAPTGSGKTLMAELVRRELDSSALYVCNGKALQDQFAGDYSYAKVLKGRANYPTQSGGPDVTAADCIATSFDSPCWHCEDGKPGCPYEIAKAQALGAELAVTNTAYFLTEANYVGNLSRRELVIADECDTLEPLMMGFIEYEVPQRYMELVKLHPPKKGARKTTLIAWLGEYAASMKVLAAREKDVKRQRAMVASWQGADRVGMELERDIRLRAADSEDNGMWLRDYDREDDRLILKPVMVNHFGSGKLWRHGEKWLLMSATVISADEMADSLGLPWEFGVVQVPMTFPVENRKVVIAPVADVSFKAMDEAVPKLAFAIARICEENPGVRVLVHTVSYDLTRKLAKALRFGDADCRLMGGDGGRSLFTYDNAKTRDEALEKYKRTEGAVLLAPSMERGIDLPGDLCRVQVICKTPFPSLGDRQISARIHLPGGQMWYTVRTVRDVVQMCGRGVRSKDDWCLTYVLDQQFARNLWGKSKGLFPKWFQEAVDTKQDIRRLIRR